MSDRRTRRLSVAVILSVLAAALACHSLWARADEAPQKNEAVPEIRPGFLKGYLMEDALPDSLALLPPPPALGSAALGLDQEVAISALALRDSPRWKLAALDANLKFPAAADAFSCALGAPVSEQATPRLYVILRRVLADAGLATGKAKKKYEHARPFMLDEAPICTPEDDKALRESGSYPSGHTSVGWAWALTLAQAEPDRADAILKRGLSFGESRIVCNVHWESDVNSGRTIGAATVAKLNSNPEFLADLAAARDEIAAARAKNLPPNRDCAMEAEALSTSILAP